MIRSHRGGTREPLSRDFAQQFVNTAQSIDLIRQSEEIGHQESGSGACCGRPRPAGPPTVREGEDGRLCREAVGRLGIEPRTRGLKVRCSAG